MSIKNRWKIAGGVIFLGILVCNAIASSEEYSSSQKTISFFGKMLGADRVDANDREVAESLPKKILEEFPNPDQQYKIALIAWALNQPSGGEFTEERQYNINLFWAAMSALSAKTNKNAPRMIMEIADRCELGGGNLVMALELAYPDPDRFRKEAVRRGVTVLEPKGAK